MIFSQNEAALAQLLSLFTEVYYSYCLFVVESSWAGVGGSGLVGQDSPEGGRDADAEKGGECKGL